MKIIEASWTDAEGQSGWLTKKQMQLELSPGRVHKSVGYVLREDEEGIMLVQTHQEPGDMVADGLFIPAAFIISTKYLRQK